MDLPPTVRFVTHWPFSHVMPLRSAYSGSSILLSSIMRWHSKFDFPMTGFRNPRSPAYCLCRFLDAVTIYAAPKCRATATPTSDLPTPVGAHSMMFLYPDPRHCSISPRMSRCICLGTNLGGK